MYKIITKYTLLGLRHENDLASHTHNMVLKPVPEAPDSFATEQAAFDWALGNHDDLRHHPEFVVLPVHHMVLSDS
ncbi:hypothetical protein GCM10011495_33520 [Hymenobacter frigidus]|uniref:Uncharacterized protein n=1 Tax=Hymenobacter frigidus TaxID=1524095 RepID=A0ABQ2AEN2_9BACT|nr:hypothetical protein [Hymenobacter frigidus]GGH89584.1 hypothetical protein GCM10011495_33520 [Hymenobacter frigidus]